MRLQLAASLGAADALNLTWSSILVCFYSCPYEWGLRWLHLLGWLMMHYTTPYEWGSHLLCLLGCLMHCISLGAVHVSTYVYTSKVYTGCVSWDAGSTKPHFEQQLHVSTHVHLSEAWAGCFSWDAWCTVPHLQQYIFPLVSEWGSRWLVLVLLDGYTSPWEWGSLSPHHLKCLMHYTSPYEWHSRWVRLLRYLMHYTSPVCIPVSIREGTRRPRFSQIICILSGHVAPHPRIPVPV